MRKQSANHSNGMSNRWFWQMVRFVGLDICQNSFPALPIEICSWITDQPDGTRPFSKRTTPTQLLGFEWPKSSHFTDVPSAVSSRQSNSFKFGFPGDSQIDEWSDKYKNGLKNHSHFPKLNDPGGECSRTRKEGVLTTAWSDQYVLN